MFGPVQIIGEPTVFTFFEMDNPDEIIKMVLDYAPEATIQVYPIEETSRFLEIWQQRKKKSGNVQDFFLPRVEVLCFSQRCICLLLGRMLVCFDF